jgi:hypothetical protein
MINIDDDIASNYLVPVRDDRFDYAFTVANCWPSQSLMHHLCQHFDRWKQ